MGRKSSANDRSLEPGEDWAAGAKGSALFPVVGLGASAGGLEALSTFFEHVTLAMGMAYVVVQHLDPKHKSMLVELLSRQSSLPVREVQQKIKVMPDQVYVIPPNHHLIIEKGELCLNPRPKSASREMPIDCFFRSLAIDRPGNCIAVVLSGTGSDGALGVEEIKSAGGITFAQDLTATYDGMPRAAISTGCIDFVLPPDQIPAELRRIAKHPFAQEKGIDLASEAGLLNRVFLLLKNRTSVDFKHYKQNTVKRRIFRRMALLKLEGLNDYVRLLSENQAELDLLYQDLLIKVTSFFREPTSFQALHDHVFPAILSDREPRELIRLWVPACSTGEEVYSLAIALLEFLGENAASVPIQIFGTDVSERALEKARAGIYIENIALDVSAERLRQWFVRIDGGYQISKQIREMCVFAKQNITTDPPFSKIDLISCRNLLIYLDTVFQSRVLPIFHYALKPTGFLMLGNSESAGTFLNLFVPIDKRIKIYTKKPVSRTVGGVPFQRMPEERQYPSLASAPPNHPTRDVQQEADRFIVSRFAPNGVIVDEDFRIVQFRGSTGDYLEPAPGRATFHLLKMAKGNLGPELRALMQRARSSKLPLRQEGVVFRPKEGDAREVSIEIAPLRADSPQQSHYLVIFEESPQASTPAEIESKNASPLVHNTEEHEREIAEVHRELASTKASLEATIEDAEAATEELKSANEEIMSSNEELQSTNEELETAKEELQSANEELTTVNEEVQSRNAELSQLNSDLNNFLGSVNIPFIMLGTDLKVRRFTPMAQRLFNIVSTDVGRSFGEIKPKIHISDLEKRIEQVIDTMVIHEAEVQDNEGHYFHMSIRPYRTPENKIEGAVLVFVDIDTIQRSLLQVEEAKLYAESIVEAILDPLLVLDDNFIIQRANSAYYRFFDATPAQTEKRSLFALDHGQWDIQEIRDSLHSALHSRKKNAPVEITKSYSRIGEKTFLAQARHIARKNGESSLILLTLGDITARKKADSDLVVLNDELSKERALFEAVLRQVNTGVAIFAAPSGKLLLANDALLAIVRTRIPSSASIDWFRRIRARNPGGDAVALEEWPMHRSLLTGEFVQKEIVLPRSGGLYNVLQVSSSPVFNVHRKMTAVVALFSDMTERVEVQNQIVEASSREQRKIAHDLHDGVGQQLAAIGYRINALKTQLPKGTPSHEAGEIGALVATALAQARDLAKFLLPVVTEERGLMHSLRELAETTSHLYKVKCVFRCKRMVLISDPEVALNAFRIAQEAVHNAIKHGKPKHVFIGFQATRLLAKLTVANDGIDFQPQQLKRKRCMGHQIMRYRVNMIHGKLTIKVRRPRGTIVECTFRRDATYDY